MTEEPRGPERSVIEQRIAELRELSEASVLDAGPARESLNEPPRILAELLAENDGLRLRNAELEAACNDLAGRDRYDANRQLRQEIAERKRAESQLQESERRYRGITEAVTDYIFTVRIQNGRAVETIHRPNCVAVTGYLPEDFEDDPDLWIKMVVKEDRKVVKEQVAKILSGLGPGWVEHRIIRKDGAARWVRNTSVPFYDDQGNLISYDGLIRDITQRKEIEVALKESEERYRLAVTGAREGLWDWNLDTGRVYFSMQGKVMLGDEGVTGEYTFDEMVERIHLDDRERFRAMIEAHLRGETNHFESEFRMGHRDGSFRWFLLRGIAIRDSQGEVARMAGTFTDTTEDREEFRHEVLEPLQRMAEDTGQQVGQVSLSPGIPSPEDELRAVGAYLRALMLEVQEARSSLERSHSRLMVAEKLSTVGRLAASVAHEIRNPLTSITMRLHSIGSAVGDDPVCEDDLRVVSEELERLENIIRNFLEFSRPPELSLAPHQIPDLLDKTLVLLQPQLESRSMVLARDVAIGLPPVVSDAEQMRQVFINLIANAIDAMGEGGEIRIGATCETQPGGERYVVVRLRDEGCGIPAEIQSRLFEPFFSTKEEGTGLGLCISAQILERHGGRLVLESSSNKGTTFAVKIPVEPPK